MKIGLHSSTHPRSGRLNILRRTQSISTLIIVDDRKIATRLAERPRIGTRLDVGAPVVVTQTKDVAGGGLIVVARVDDAPAA